MGAMLDLKQFPIKANHFASSIGVKLRFGGDRIYTDGSLIYMPYPTVEFYDLSLGFLCHESSHIKRTNFKAIEGFCKKWRNPTFAKWIWNVLEDVRIERLFLCDFSGTRAYFEEVAKFLVKNSIDKNGLSITTLDGYIYFYVRGHLSNYRAMREKVEECWKYSETLDSEFVQKLNEILDKANVCDSSKEIFDLSEELLEFLGAEKIDLEQQPRSENNEHPSDNDSSPDPENKDGESDEGTSGKSSQGEETESSVTSTGSATDASESQDGDETDEGTSGKSSQNEETKASGASTGSAKDSSESQDGDGSDEGTSGKSSQDGGTESNAGSGSKSESDNNGNDDEEHSESEQPVNSRKEKTQKAIEEILNLDDETDESVPSGELGDIIKKFLQAKDAIDKVSELQHKNECVLEPEVTVQPDVDPAELISESAIATGGLKRKIESIIASLTQCKKNIGRKGRKISPKRYMTQVPRGNLSVMINKTQPKLKPQASVCILIDDSGSIGSNLCHVQRSAWTLFDVLNGIQGVDTSGYVFGSVLAKGFNQGTHSGVTIVKDWYEPVKLAAGRIQACSANGHSTPLYPALEGAERSFMFSPPKKEKILIVLTDGAPDNLDACKTKISELKQKDIRVIGIGIGSGVDKRFMQTQYGDDYIHVPTFEDLPVEILNLANNIITK
ncbi:MULTISPECIES: VWA domain-containing protein [Vibrio]|uniref:VWA domain-containing protein n=2 Tax=Vibrionaceae TaxID=641 RepID=UPI00084225EF|nr:MULTISPECIES: VWA domain-containing protein [Vibrio]ODM56854.1 hypothetical protein BC455_18515 [Vibrio harveyi]USD58504.1 VWA domain-containing protein [Vibrio sp. SCSIO 43155]